MEKRIFPLSAVGAAFVALVGVIRFMADLASLPEGARSLLNFVSAIPAEWASALFCIGLILAGTYVVWRVIVRVGDMAEGVAMWVKNKWFPPPPPIGAGEIQMSIWEAEPLLGSGSWMNAGTAPEELLARMAPMLYRLKANGIELYHPPLGREGKARLGVVVAQLKAIHPWIADGRLDIARNVAAENLRQLSAGGQS